MIFSNFEDIYRSSQRERNNSSDQILGMDEPLSDHATADVPGRRERGGGKKTVMTESIHRACLPAWFPSVRPVRRPAVVQASGRVCKQISAGGGGGTVPPPPPPPPPSAAPSLRPSPHLCGSSALAKLFLSSSSLASFTCGAPEKARV